VGNLYLENRLLTYSKLHSTERNRCRNSDFHFLFCASSWQNVHWNLSQEIAISFRQFVSICRGKSEPAGKLEAGWGWQVQKLEPEPDADADGDGDADASAALWVFGQCIDAKISCILFNKVCFPSPKWQRWNKNKNYETWWGVGHMIASFISLAKTFALPFSACANFIGSSTDILKLYNYIMKYPHIYCEGGGEWYTKRSHVQGSRSKPSTISRWNIINNASRAKMFAIRFR